MSPIIIAFLTRDNEAIQFTFLTRVLAAKLAATSHALVLKAFRRETWLIENLHFWRFCCTPFPFPTATVSVSYKNLSRLF